MILFTYKRAASNLGQSAFPKASALAMIAFFCLGQTPPVMAESGTCPNMYNATLPTDELNEKIIDEVILPTPPAAAPLASSMILELDSATTAATKGSEPDKASGAVEELILQQADNAPKAQEIASDIGDKAARGADGKEITAQVSLGLPAGSILGKVEKDECASSASAPLVVDNDEAKETKETIKYKELATDDGGTQGSHRRDIPRGLLFSNYKQNCQNR